MTGLFPTICNLRWEELLSSEEIRNWVNQQQSPTRLSTEVAYPGVYRFIFAEARDGASVHTPCYVGEAGNIGERLRDHFLLESPGPGEEIRLGTSGPPSAGWQVRGAIRNSGGDFKLQVLTLTGRVNFCGFTFEPDSIYEPFHDSFVRKMVENCAVLASEYRDNLWPLNRRGTPHIFEDMVKKARKTRTTSA